LCSDCSSKAKANEISVEEIAIYKLFNKYSKIEPILKNVEIKRILLKKDFALIVTNDEDISKLIGKNGIIIKKLSKKLDKQLRVVTDKFTVDEFAREILFSSSILGVNVVYSQEGEEYKIRMTKKDKNSLQIEPETFSSMAKTVLGKKVEIVFE